MTEDQEISAFERIYHSIRTRYSLATATFLLAALAVFYIGGRIVLVHLMREAEEQVREIGSDISRIAYRNADRIKRENLKCVRAAADLLASEHALAGVLGDFETSGISLLADFDTNGAFRACAVLGTNGVENVSGDAFAAYAECLEKWRLGLATTNDATRAVGIVQIGARPHYASLTHYAGRRSGYLLIGSPFDSRVFSGQVNEGFTGLNVRITNRRGDVAVAVRSQPVRASAEGSDERSAFGLAPMLSEALNFYSGGFWDLGSNPFEAVFAVRDIAGNAVTVISVSLPSTMTNLTRSALGRLTFFIAMGGILFVLPIFWFQSRVLLNPLTKMTKDVAALGEHHADTDCPRLDWKGKDEFAILAMSVNRMLEALSARSLAVAQSEARQKALIEAVPDALAVFDRRYRLVTITKDSSDAGGLPCAVPGHSLSDIVFGVEGRRRFEASLAEVFRTGRPSPAIRLTLQHASWVPQDAPTRTFEIRLVRMDDIFALACVRDISDMVSEHRQLVAARERLKEGEKRDSLALFAAGIAHDVNNVLSVIANTMTATWMTPSRPEEREAIHTVHDALRRGARMMGELREYARESKMKLVRASPSVVIADMKLLIDRVVPPQVAVMYEVGTDLPDIDVDINQFWKVVFNIVKNAGEAFGEKPGHVTVRVTRHELTAEGALRYRSAMPLKPGAGVLFTLSDDGPGIRPDILARIFDPYVSSKSVSRGLGLATVCAVVEAHGGGIAVDSVLEHGTTFSVFLPESQLRPAAEAKRSDEAATSLEGEILVVDDEAPILRTTGILLKSLGLDPHLAQDENEAMAVVRRHAPELKVAIVDANLSETQSARLLANIRELAPEVKLVLSSGSTEEQLRTTFAAAAYDAFLAKPYTLRELRSVLVKVIA